MLRAQQSNVPSRIALAFIAAIASLHGGSRGVSIARAEPTAGSATAFVVLARARMPSALAPRTQVRIANVSPNSDTAVTPIGVLTHPPDAIVRGDLIVRGGALVSVALVADERPKNEDYGSALYVLDVHGGAKNGASVPRRLAANVVHATRPLAHDGVIFVQRGSRGIDPTPAEARAGQLRVDPLEIDAVDPVTGGVRVLATWNGYATHVAGVFGQDLIVYRVGPRGAEIAGVDRSSGAARTIAKIPPFARDFSIDAGRGALVLSNRDDRDESTWVVERVDLAGGARTRLTTTRDDAQTAFAFRDGSTFWSAPGRNGLASDRAPDALAPFGLGYTYVTNATADGEWLALAHVPRDRGFDRAGVFRRGTKHLIELGSRTERVDVVGFIGESKAHASGGLR